VQTGEPIANCIMSGIIDFFQGTAEFLHIKADSTVPLGTATKVKIVGLDVYLDV